MKIPGDPIDRAILFLQLNSLGMLLLTEEEKELLTDRVTNALFKTNWLLEFLKKDSEMTPEEDGPEKK